MSEERDRFVSIEAIGRIISLMAGQVSGADTGPAAAGRIEHLSAVQTAELKRWIERLTGSNREAFAQELGWPNADALQAFVEGGKIPGDSVN